MPTALTEDPLLQGWSVVAARYAAGPNSVRGATIGDFETRQNAIVNRPSASLRSQPRSASLVNFPRSRSSLPPTSTGKPSAPPTSLTFTGPAPAPPSAKLASQAP